jgi:AcrR family transcriptional regulator
LQNALLATPAKPSQRDRLMRAMVELAARDGYGEVSIGRLATSAGVSQSTFYERFAGKEECFAAAYEDCAQRLVGGMQNAVRAAPWEQAIEAALSSLLGAVAEDPAAGWLLFVEALANRMRVLGGRPGLMDVYEQTVEDLLHEGSKNELTLDVPAIALIGAVRAVVSRRLRAGAADQLPLLAGELSAWMAAYATPLVQDRWSTGPSAMLRSDPTALPGASRMPSADKPEQLPRGRRKISAASVARNYRARIMYATAEVVCAKGYAEMTVSDIVSAAGIARDVFYQQFADKQDAFLSAQQHNLYENLTAGAIGFFEGESWPERMWNVLQSLTTFVAEQPAVAHLRFVEPFAVGPQALQRMDDLTLNFTFFVSEGFSCNPRARDLPHLCTEAIAGATFEAIRQQVALGKASELPRHLPQLTYVAVAPFIGPRRAVQAIERIAAEHQSIAAKRR